MKKSLSHTVWECKCHKNNLSRKYIFAYELEKGILGPAPQREEEDWVSKEFQYAELPNKAKKGRLISLTRDSYTRPASPIPLCCKGQAKDLYFMLLNS